MCGLIALVCLPFPRLTAALLYEFDVTHDHASINGLAHIVDCE